MTFVRFKQVCEDYGLDVIVNPNCKNEKGEYTYARAFFKNEVVAVYDRRRMYCYKHPITFRYANRTMLIDNGESTEVYSTTELEENIVQTIGKLKRFLLKLKSLKLRKNLNKKHCPKKNSV